ncbi:hypothetical protein OAW22_07085 [Pseudomonadales bacterium]|nr:hypothetical protein [Pseudomonadales bacterium]
MMESIVFGQVLYQQLGDPHRFQLQREVAGVFENLEAIRSLRVVGIGHCGLSRYVASPLWSQNAKHQ